MYYIKVKDDVSISGYYLSILVDSVSASGFNNYEYYLEMDTWDATKFVNEEDAQRFIDILGVDPNGYIIVEV